MKTTFLILRATNRRHIRLGEDNLTEELSMETISELDPNEDLKGALIEAMEVRDNLARNNDLSLDTWEKIRREMGAPGFRTAAELHEQAPPPLPPLPLPTTPPETPPITPPTPTPPAAGGYHRGKKATPGQVNKIADLCNESQLAAIAYPKEMLRLNKQKAEHLTMAEASHLIDLLIAESRRERGL